MSSDIIHKTKITTSLGTFEFEGSQEFIEKQIEKIITLASTTPVMQTTDSQPDLESVQKEKAKKSIKKVSIEQPQMLPNLIESGEKIKSLREFYDSKSPETHIEIFAVLTYWLKNNIQLSEVSINEMWTLYKILSIKPPKVLIQSFRDGKSKKGYFEAGSTSGKYYLTPFGETLIEHDLPKKKAE